MDSRSYDKMCYDFVNKGPGLSARLLAKFQYREHFPVIEIAIVPIQITYTNKTVLRLPYGGKYWRKRVPDIPLFNFS